jgi:hypothetical protein
VYYRWMRCLVRVVIRLVTCLRSDPLPNLGSTFFGATTELHIDLPKTPPHFLMLNCRTCLWRCIQALDTPTNNVHRLRRDVNPIFLPSQQRLLSTTRDVVRRAETKPTDLTEVEKLSRQGEEPWKKSAFAANQKKRERAALRQPPPDKVYETPNLAKLGRRDPTISERDWHNRKQELRHLQDPLELATFVKSELGKGKAIEMLQLVRMASHSMQCIVSWNHIIDHYLAKERVSDALKVYNDVCWLCLRMMEHNANWRSDEKARTISRFIHIHYTSAWLVYQRAHVGCPEQSAFRIPLAFCTELTRGTVHHTYKCCIASLRKSIGHGCFVGHCGKDTDKTCCWTRQKERRKTRLRRGESVVSWKDGGCGKTL